MTTFEEVHKPSDVIIVEEGEREIGYVNVRPLMGKHIILQFIF